MAEGSVCLALGNIYACLGEPQCDGDAGPDCQKCVTFTPDELEHIDMDYVEARMSAARKAVAH